MKRPPEPGPPRPFVPPPFLSTTLPSGLHVRAARWGKRPTVAVNLLFPGAGSASDPDGCEGTAEIAADTFVTGTATKDARQIAEAIDELAASIELSAGFDSSVARLYVLEKDLEEGLALFAELLAEAAFPEPEVEKSRRRHIDLLTEQRSEPDFLARERLLDRLYPGHPYGRLTATEKGLTTLTRDEVAAHYHQRCTMTGATMILVGAADPERLLAAATRAFSGFPHAPQNGLPQMPAAPIVRDFTVHLVNRPGSVQTNLLFARPATRRADVRYASAVVANQSLGGGASSRLFHVLREERSLTYGAYSSLAPRVGAGHFGASIDCRTEVTREALTGLLGLIREFAVTGPTEEEHARSKKYLVGSFVLARETAGAIAQDETNRILHGLPDDEWFTWRERLSSVTIAQAKDVARILFDPSVGVLAAVGDATKIRATLEEFGETTLWDADGPLR
jgi:predicted Zn-dependent peptidase